MTTSYAKLRDDSWGIRTDEDVETGDEVIVTTKAGKSVPEVLGDLVWQGEGVTLWRKASAAKAEKTTTSPTTKRKSSPPKGWAPCGYPGCNPSYCDECDGKGASRSYGNHEPNF